MQMPDLRTKEGSLDFINSGKCLDEDQVEALSQVSDRFMALLELLWDYIPGGPGKTIFH